MIGKRPEIDPRGRYSAAQAGELLEVNKATVDRWGREGKLPRRISKVNGRIRYVGADLLKLWEWETRFIPNRDL